MKFLLSQLCFLFLAVSAYAQEISQAEIVLPNSNFELIIENIPSDEGEIRIAIFNSESSYKEKEKPSHAVVVPVQGDSVVWKADELPYGNYAIAVYHDKNVNGKLDSNLLGIPKEAYGFSNNARGRFGPASWKDAHFDVSQNSVRMTIRVK